MPVAAQLPTQSFVALLRGVNVGGRKPVGMAALRNWMEVLGFVGAKTILQSGNIVFSSCATEGSGLEARLKAEAARRLGLACDFHVRTLPEWEAIIRANPFPDQAVRDPSHLVAVLLKRPATGPRLAALHAAIVGREAAKAVGRTIYIYYPDGIGPSRLTTAVIDRCLRAQGTARNWNTMQKLQALARVI